MRPFQKIAWFAQDGTEVGSKQREQLGKIIQSGKRNFHKGDKQWEESALLERLTRNKTAASKLSGL